MACKDDMQKLVDALKDTFTKGNNKICTVRKVSRQCPLVLLTTVDRRQGRASRTAEGRVKRKRNICVSNRGNKSGIWKSVLKKKF
jgi:hypothetical protein